jgi:hypothetical protein
VIQWLHENANVIAAPRRPAALLDLQTLMATLKWNEFIEKWSSVSPERPLKWTPGDAWTQSVNAVDWAAQTGRMDILGWFEENRDEGCSPNAILLAAEAGNMEALIWLHSHYSSL